jgi:hypothetical protein
MIYDTGSFFMRYRKNYALADSCAKIALFFAN